MQPESVRKFLTLLGAQVPTYQPRTGWIISDCPLGAWNHTEGKSAPGVFGVRLEHGDAFCNCFACGWHGRQSDLVLRMKMLNTHNFSQKYMFGEVVQLIAQAEETLELEGLDSPTIDEILFGGKKLLHEFPQWWLDSFPPVEQAQWAMDYINFGREGCDPVPKTILKLLDVRADFLQKRVCFPVRGFDTRLYGLHGRAVGEAVEPRYRMYLQDGHNNQIVWLGEHWVDLSRPIVVVEGPFDLASVLRVYRNAVTPLFANPSLDKLKRMGDATEWVTFLDRGVGGDKGRERIEKFVKDGVVNHVIPPKGKKDPGACNIDQLGETLASFVKLDQVIVD